MKKLFFLMLSASLLLLTACSKDDGDDVLSKAYTVYNDSAVPSIPYFSVSATTKVLFSPGNLQYNASTGAWRFAEHQWDYIGNDNENIDKNYDGWIDLFGWGTGNDPSKFTYENGEYKENFVIWDANNISAIQILGSGWYTLSKEEWEYLISRNGKYGLAKIDKVNGMVLLPDSFTLPDGCKFTSGYGSGWTTNNYTSDQWSKMEKAGAVFLPAAGRRDEKEVLVAGTTGAYWSSEKYNASTASSFNFSSSSVKVGYTAFYYGQSVRLVRGDAFAPINL